MSDIPDPSVATAETIVERLPDLILELSADGIYLAFHTGDESDLYRPPEDFIGKHFRDVLPPSIAESFQTALDEIDANGSTKTFNYVLPIDDEPRFYECRFLPTHTGHRLAVIRNITESWHSRNKLEQSESKFRALVNNIPGMVYRCHIDSDWSAIYISENVEEIIGYPAEDFLSNKQTLGSCTHPEDRKRIQKEVDRAIKAGQPYDLTYRMINGDGDVRHMHERGRALYSKVDDTNYLDGVVFDVTEIHQMRQRVLVNHKMAAVGSLAAGVAHEINNPLAIILANLEYVSEELTAISEAVTADKTVVEALDDVGTAISKIRNGTDRVRRIIDDLRTFSDAAESRADQLDLRRLVSWAVQRFDTHTSLEPVMKIELGSVPTIWASEVGVVQVVWNLLENALDALSVKDSDTGELSISLSSQNDSVVLEISDNGEGMDEEVARRAFDPFFTTKAVGEGAGLGLFVCQGLIEGMDGEIDLETTPGVGTRVRVSFPSFHRP